MAQDVHPMAPHHLPAFLPGPDGADPLFTFTVVMLLGAAMLLGVLYLSLHSVPERMAHSANNVQLQAVAVLTLLALFTHNHLFWIIALLIAVVRLPDYATPLNTIARALAKREGVDHSEPAAADKGHGDRDHA
jgi:hypothetical protein